MPKRLKKPKKQLITLKFNPDLIRDLRELKKYGIKYGPVVEGAASDVVRAILETMRKQKQPGKSNENR